MGKQKADYLLRSDHIFTSTVENPFAGYVAVSGQNILAVGTDDGSDWIDEQTEVLELGDQLVTPGFIDVHTFFTGYAIFHIGIDMSGITSQEEFLQKIKEQVEKEILQSGADLDAEMLKVGHHGSQTSTSDAFLDEIDPDYALISAKVGNKYDHPMPATMAKLEARNIEVYRTDEQGNVVITITAKKITFNCTPGDYQSGTQLAESSKKGG